MTTLTGVSQGQSSALLTLIPLLGSVGVGVMYKMALLITLKALGNSCYINYIISFLLQLENKFPLNYASGSRLSYIFAMCLWLLS
jgi:hypothetical protein